MIWSKVTNENKQNTLALVTTFARSDWFPRYLICTCEWGETWIYPISSLKIIGEKGVYRTCYCWNVRNPNWVCMCGVNTPLGSTAHTTLIGIHCLNGEGQWLFRVGYVCETDALLFETLRATRNCLTYVLMVMVRDYSCLITLPWSKVSKGSRFSVRESNSPRNLILFLPTRGVT